MEKELVQAFKSQLLGELERLHYHYPLNLLSLRDVAQQRDQEEDEVQGAKIIFLETRLSSRHQLYRNKIIKALRKIDEGHYGQCEECEGVIEEGRLKARPVAGLCIVCKEQEELVQDQQRLPLV